MAMEAVAQKAAQIALYMLVAFMTYLRPGEVSKL